MASHPWKEKLRTLTGTILAAVAELHPPRAPAARLATAAADTLRLIESVNGALEDALIRERQCRMAAEKRIENLEQRMENVVNPSPRHEEELHQQNRAYVHPRRESQGDRNREHFRERRKRTVQCESMHHSPRRKRKRIKLNDAEPIHNFTQSHPDSPNPAAERQPIEASPKSHTGDEDPVHMPQLDNGTTKRVRAEKSLPVTPPRKPLPPLPTLAQVQHDWALRRAERREKERFQPLPCDKCKLRKRAVMLRQDGYVREDVFERWARKPGNCLHYMHQDSEVPQEQGRYSLTFEETETQEP